MLFQSVVVNSQAAGAFSILSLQNLPSGQTECIIAWGGNTITTARALNISVDVSGTTACVDATLSTIDSYFTDPANGFMVTFSNSGVTILKNPNGSNTFSLATGYSPLVTLLFNADPGTSATVSALGTVIQSGFSGIPITSTSATITAPGGFNLVGQISKAISGLAGWQSCAASTGIPGTTVSVSTPSGSCFPSTSYPVTQLFPQPPYQFFNAPSGYSYTITPTKSSGQVGSTWVCCGVWTEDIDATRELIIGLDVGNLAQYLAADFNGNGFATSNDIYYMWQCYNLIDPVFPSGWSPWRFVPESVWAANDPPNGDMNLIPSAAITGPISSNQIHHFKGVKRGDVNGDCNNCGTSLTNDPSDGREQAEGSHSFFMPADLGLLAGEELLLPISTQGLSGATLWGMQLDFDAEHFDLLSINSQMLSEDDMVMSNIISDSKIHSAHFSWMSMKLEGQELKEGTVVAYAQIRAKKDIHSFKGLIEQPNNPNYRSIYSNRVETPSVISLVFGGEKAAISFSAKLVSQNPLTDFAQIDVMLPQESETALIIFDNMGRVQQQQVHLLKAGINSLVLSNLSLESGIYTACIQTKFGIQNLRFVKI